MSDSPREIQKTLRKSHLPIGDGVKTLSGLTFHAEVPTLSTIPRKLQGKVDCSRASKTMNTKSIQKGVGSSFREHFKSDFLSSLLSPFPFFFSTLLSTLHWIDFRGEGGVWHQYSAEFYPRDRKKSAIPRPESRKYGMIGILFSYLSISIFLQHAVQPRIYRLFIFFIFI